MKMIEMTIVATIRVHDERPAMDRDERQYLERALVEAVRTALADSFLQHEPNDSAALVTSVTVSFSGHVNA